MKHTFPFFVFLHFIAKNVDEIYPRFKLHSFPPKSLKSRPRESSLDPKMVLNSINVGEAENHVLGGKNTCFLAGPVFG